jgi:tetratricopeptide (TPR) repeat protein
MYERYNTFPDFGGAAATEISARWRGAEDIRQADAQWHDLIKRATDANVQHETWLVYGFFCNLKSARAMLEGSQFVPASDLNQQVLRNTLNLHEGLRSSAESRGLHAVAAYPDWWSADLCRRAGDTATAEQNLARAEVAFERAGDPSGVALCRMTRADWRCAPFSSPLAWNLALQDSSSEGSHLSVPVENQEFSRPAATDIEQARIEFADAERLFQEAGAMRGVSAIRLRYGYLAMLGDDFLAAAEFAGQARDGFEKCGDWRGGHTAGIHQAMAQIGLGREADAVEAARAVGGWGREQGSFSFVLGLGILLNRWARHWLIRGGDYERALAGYRASHELFEALQATANATQNIVDRGVVHQAIGERNAAFLDFEKAIARYAEESERRPPIADNLRQRAIMLTASVYQLCLQQTDPDGMQRSADRLKQQLARLPDATGGANWLSALDGNGTADTTPGVEFWGLRNMAQLLIDQAAVLAPLYRSRKMKDAGNEQQANRFWNEAEAALSRVGDDQRPFLAVSVYAERRRYDRAADAFRQYLNRGGADAGFAGQISQRLQEVGGSAAQAEARLQRIRTHEQAFSVFVRVKSYQEAKSHLEALRQLAGDDWWSDDAKPWQLLSDCGEMQEGLGSFTEALKYYDLAIQQLDSRRNQLSRDELKTALSGDKGAQYLYFQAARTAIRNKQYELAFDYAERGKARALLDLMAGSADLAAMRKQEAAGIADLAATERPTGLATRVAGSRARHAETRRPADRPTRRADRSGRARDANDRSPVVAIVSQLSRGREFDRENALGPTGRGPLARRNVVDRILLFGRRTVGLDDRPPRAKASGPGDARHGSPQPRHPGPAPRVREADGNRRVERAIV